MSYLTSYATRRFVAPGAETRGIRLKEENRLNLLGHHGDAHVRVFVEDTTHRRWRRTPPEPRVRLRISDCAEEISLWFEVDSPERRQNSRHKVDTLIDTLTRFRTALDAECELYEHRCLHGRQ